MRFHLQRRHQSCRLRTGESTKRRERRCLKDEGMYALIRTVVSKWRQGAGRSRQSCGPDEGCRRTRNQIMRFISCRMIEHKLNDAILCNALHFGSFRDDSGAELIVKPVGCEPQSAVDIVSDAYERADHTSPAPSDGEELARGLASADECSECTVWQIPIYFRLACSCYRELKTFIKLQLLARPVAYAATTLARCKRQT